MNVHTEKSLYLPALKCKMGDWVYFATSMRIADIVSRVGFASEMRHPERYSDWLQREIRPDRLEQISAYLQSRPDRFFSSLVVSVYSGTPTWHDLTLFDTDTFTVDQLSSLEVNEINEALGLLQLSGGEDLFALDGQHRLGGLREAYRDNPSIGDEILSVLFVADRGKQQTRRLFTTLNRYATRITPGERVILDEDDAFAIVTRQLAEEHPFLSHGDRVSSPKQLSLSVASVSVTTPLTIYKICDILCAELKGGTRLADDATPWTRRRLTESVRPHDRVLGAINLVCSEFWTATSKQFGLNRQDEESPTSRVAGKILFRPVGQMAFARAVRHCIDTSDSVESGTVRRAVTTLHKAVPARVFNVSHPVWHNLLWNPVSHSMLNGVARQKVAALILCRYAGIGVGAGLLNGLEKMYQEQVGDDEATIPPA